MESIYASGIIKSRNQYEVFTKISGTIQKIYVQEGDTVKKGDPIFLIENINSAISAENARITAEANDFLRNQEKLKDAKNQLELARKKLSNDSLNLVRQQNLWRQGIGSKVELEQRELTYENAKVNLKRSSVVYEDTRRQLKLASDQSKNNLKIAKASANDLIIRSEVDGLVYQINARVGELATSVSPMATIGLKDFLIELNVDEYDIVKIRHGQKVLVKMDSYKNRAFPAEINFVYPMMNERTRSFKVEALFVEAPETLYPNLSLEANIIIQEKKNVLSLPSEYIQEDSTVILADGKTKKLKLGLRDFQITEILEGADENTKIRDPRR